VYRDKEFFRVTVSEIEKVWMKVLEYRSNEALYRGAVKTTARTKRKPVFMFRECQGDTI
jgi:hypothetical protein